MKAARPLPEAAPPQRPMTDLHFSKPVMTMIRDEAPLPIAAYRQDRAAQQHVEGRTWGRRAEASR